MQQLTFDSSLTGFLLGDNLGFCFFSNVLKSGTLLSTAPERHPQNQERCGSGTRIFEESKNMSAHLFPLFFLTFSYFFISKFTYP